MSTLVVSPPDNLGRFAVETTDDGGILSRRVLQAGHYEQSGALWVDTDISVEGPEVKTAAVAAWTSGTIAALKAFEQTILAAVPPPTAEQLRIAAYRADPTRAYLITLIQGSTPAQVNTWLANNVTTLPQARGVLAQIILLLGGTSLS